MDLVEVEIILPDGSRRSGRLDPEAAFEDMKDSIMRAFMVGEDPDRYDIAIIPRSKNTAPGYRIGSNDVILIVAATISRGPIFIPNID